MIYPENPKDPNEKSLYLIKKLSKVIQFKIKRKESTAVLYASNNQILKCLEVKDHNCHNFK